MKNDIPKCIFVPEKAFLRKLITTVAKCSSFESVKNKFGACWRDLCVNLLIKLNQLLRYFTTGIYFNKRKIDNKSAKTAQTAKIWFF